jgi:hypothetical protein
LDVLAWASDNVTKKIASAEQITRVRLRGTAFDAKNGMPQKEAAFAPNRLSDCRRFGKDYAGRRAISSRVPASTSPGSHRAARSLYQATPGAAPT